MMRFEWKKIFERKLNIAAMALGYVLIAFCVFNFITQASFYDEQSQSYIYGINAFRLSHEKMENEPDFITDAYVTQVVKDIQSCNMDLESDDAYVEIIRPLGDLFYLLAKNYTDLRSPIADRNALNAIDITEGAHFYAQRMKKITDYLNADFSFGNYSDAEKEYWIKKAKETDTPFAWGDKSVMDTIWSAIGIGFYLLFVIVICLSSVFSSEHESGAANLLFTTKYGKDKLIRTKIFVSLLFTVGYLLTGNIAAFIVIGLLLGFPGTDLPVQLWNSVIPYNLTASQACILNLVILILVAMGISLFLLYCSARLHSSLAALVIGMAVLIAPAFFPMSKKSGLWNHINYLFPVRVFDLKGVLGSFVSYGFGNLVIPYIGMIAIAYIVIGIAALLLIRKGFVKMR
ncbi:MAG: ABC transporter permease [Roseburia sp.]|nr:ABC transporter permease [Roseburia sp.]